LLAAVQPSSYLTPPHPPIQEELKTRRSLRAFKDPRVHVCLYCLAPTITSLKSLDLVVMKRLQEKVNVVPVITKADTVTQEEMAEFKALVSRGSKRGKVLRPQLESFLYFSLTGAPCRQLAPQRICGQWPDAL